MSALPAGQPAIKSVLIATDAWHPQINGVVRTLERTAGELTAMGIAVRFVTPDGGRSLPFPGEPGLRLALGAKGRIKAALDGWQPDAIHIATEGPVGFAARQECLRRGWAFTTAYHTRFPDYAFSRWRVPRGLTYRAIRWFHGPSSAVMVATPAIAAELRGAGLSRLALWSRGVDLDRFNPRPPESVPRVRKKFLTVARVAPEKNLEAFCALDLPGDKILVGGGPDLDRLRRRYRDVQFLGPLTGDALAQAYRDADVFVFPSRTDTFGLVVLEAMASGLPVAAFPVQGPADIIGGSGAGVVDPDLGRAARAALLIAPEVARAHAATFSWQASTSQFLANLAPVSGLAGHKTPSPAPADRAAPAYWG